MTGHIPNPHTPAQERLLSNIGHWIEGGILSVAGGAMLLDALGSSNDRYENADSALLAGAGSVLGLGLIAGSFHHGGPVTYFKADHQQRQHLQMAGLITGAGMSRRAGTLGRVVASGLVGKVGHMFLTHEQHGTGEAAEIAKAKHQRLGQTILAGAGTIAVGDLFGWKLVGAAGSVLMLAAGLQLLTYKEPEGAYELENEKMKVNPDG